MVLCELEGLSRSEAARRLGIPEGTLSNRLARARARLRDRLVSRGVSLPAAALSAILFREVRALTVPPSLLESTVQAATVVATGPYTAAAVSAAVASLSDGVLKTMLIAKLKGIALAIEVMTAVVSGAVVLARSGQPGTGPERGNAPAGVQVGIEGDRPRENLPNGRGLGEQSALAKRIAWLEGMVAANLPLVDEI